MYTPKYRGAKETTCGICEACTYCEPHHVFPGTARRISDEYGAVVYLCRNCHESYHRHPGSYKWLQSKVQADVMFRQGWTLEDWMNHFHKNYM